MRIGDFRSFWRSHFLTSPVVLLAAVSVFAAEPATSGNSTAEAKDSLPADVDLRPQFEGWRLDRRQQHARPTCSAFTVAGALEYAMAKQQGKGTRLSIDFLNWSANKVCGEADDGGFFSDLWKGFAAHGICDESEMPYAQKFDPQREPGPAATAKAKPRLDLALRWHWIKEWDVNTGLTDAHLEAIRRTLNQGWPVCGGFRWPKQARWENGVLQMCAADAVYDGHSVLLVGYRQVSGQPGGGVFIFRNTSGDGRDGSMPFAYAQAYMNDAAWVDFDRISQASASAR